MENVWKMQLVFLFDRFSNKKNASRCSHLNSNEILKLVYLEIKGLKVWK